MHSVWKFIVAIAVISYTPAFANEESEEIDDEVAASASTDGGKSEEPKEEGWNIVQMPYSAQNIQVPRELWDYIKEILKKDKVSDKTLEEFSLQPISVTVEITSEDEFVLKDRLNQRLQFTDGGGEVDMFNYVSGKGLFNLRIAPHLKDGKRFHLLYISDSPIKKVDGDSWGNGCGKIFNLTDQAEHFLFGEGMKLTSSRRHYLHLMAGTFIFFQLIDDKLSLGYTRIMDSRFPQFNCKSAG